MQVPQTAEEWKRVAQGFNERWNFPHTLGAIDGKHIRIKNPAFGGSHYFNYKFFSMILLAIVDSDYKFIYMDVGAIGSESDAGVFAQSQFGEMLANNHVNLPAADRLPHDPTNKPVDYCFVGDDAFALRNWMMKPYPLRNLNKDEQIYNYRRSRACRVVENVFGILANR